MGMIIKEPIPNLVIAQLTKASKLTLGLLALIMGVHSSGLESENSFLVLIEDNNTLHNTGHNSYRMMYADAIKILKESGARSVTLKYFFFHEDKPDIDQALAKQLASTESLLQFALVSKQGKTNLSPDVLEKVIASQASTKSFPGALKSTTPQPPISIFSKAVKKLGFVDVVEPFSINKIPLIGDLDGKLVKSLTFQLLEQRFGNAEIDGNVVRFDRKELQLDSRGKASCTTDHAFELVQASLFDFLDSPSSIPTADRHVLVVYSDGPEIEISNSDRMPIHEVFLRRLACLDNLLEQQSSRS